MVLNVDFFSRFDASLVSPGAVPGFLFLVLLGTASMAGANPTVELNVQKPVIVNDGSFEVSVRVENSSDEGISVNLPAELKRGLNVSLGGNTVETSISAPENSSERTIDARHFVGTTVQVTPKKSWNRPVQLDISWKHDELSSGKESAYYFPERMAEISVEGFGEMYLSFYYREAPRNVYHFMNLIREDSFYDGKEFHRLIKGFLLQGGASQEPGTDSHSVAPEFSDKEHKLGTVSMAHGHRSRTSGTQFFITLGRQPFLDGQYTVIGQVKPDSHPVLRQIQEQVRTDHKENGGICGVDHMDAPEQPLVMNSVQLLTPEEYQQKASEEENDTGGSPETGEESETSSNNPLKSGSASEEGDQ